MRGEESSHSVGPKCSRCRKTVYFAEEVVACRRKWHKMCLKCGEILITAFSDTKPSSECISEAENVISTTENM